MPTITVLSWNIENLGKKKREESNGEIFSLIARTIHEAGASLVGLLEIPRTDPDLTDTRNGLVPALNAIPGHGNWENVFVDAGYKEGYLIFWDTTKGFSPVKKAGAGPGPHYAVAEVEAGLTESDASGTRIHFPTGAFREGGRPAGYCTFETTNGPFIYAAFHAGFPGGATTYTPTGGIQLAKARELAQPRVVLGGDFNVDLDDDLKLAPHIVAKCKLPKDMTTVEAMYGSLEASLIPGMARRTPDERTSLIRERRNVSAALARDSSTVACRASQYDHIFEKGLSGAAGGVIDMLEWLYAGEDIYRLNIAAFNNAVQSIRLTANEEQELEQKVVNKDLSKREIQNIASGVFTKKVGSSGRVRTDITKRNAVVLAMTVSRNRRRKKTDTRGPLADVVSNYGGKVAITTKKIGEGINQMAISSMFDGNGYELLSVYDRWLFYRYLVSDHLPVWLRITI